MIIKQSREADKLTIALEGRLDTVTSPELETVLVSAIDGVAELVFDLTALEYISSAGLRVILKAQKVMYTQGTMKLIGVCETVKEVFEITGFDNILNIE